MRSAPPTRRRRWANDYPYGVIGDAYDPVIWGANEPPEHKKFIADLKAFSKAKYASGWSIVGYQSIYALAEGIKKAGNTKSDDVSKALLGLSFDTPVGKRTFSVKSHETFAPEYWGVMVKDPELSIRHHQGTPNAARRVPDELTRHQANTAARDPGVTAGNAIWGNDRRCRARFCSASSWAGFTTAMFLFLIASGLSLVFGVMRVINFAHGSFYMLGAYLAWQGVAWLEPAGRQLLAGDIVRRGRRRGAWAHSSSGCSFARSTAARNSTSCCSPMRWC